MTLDREGASEDGRFAIRMPDDGSRYALRATDRASEIRSSYVEVDPETSEVELRLRPSATLTGRIVAPPGPALDPAYVTWRPAEDASDQGLHPVGIKLKDDLVFTLKDVPAGRVDLALLRDRHGEPVCWRRGVEVPPEGGTVTVPDWSIEGHLVPRRFSVVYPGGVAREAIVYTGGDWTVLEGTDFEGWAAPAGADLTIVCEGCRTYPLRCGASGSPSSRMSRYSTST